MYCEWYGVCDFVVLSFLRYVLADYGGVNVFHVCLNFDVVYGVGVCVNVCVVVCVVIITVNQNCSKYEMTSLTLGPSVLCL